MAISTVELFVKWIKQHLRIKKFLGTSENAAKTQVWCAVASYDSCPSRLASCSFSSLQAAAMPCRRRAERCRGCGQTSKITETMGESFQISKTGMRALVDAR